MYVKGVSQQKMKKLDIASSVHQGRIDLKNRDKCDFSETNIFESDCVHS